MNVSPIGAIYQVMNAHLKNGSPIWQGRVQPLAMASAGLEKPCLMFFHASGGRELSVPVRDSARFTLTVKIVAEAMQQAVDGQAAISTLLHNSGAQDVSPRLPTHVEWDVLTVTEGREVWIEEAFEKAKRIYHAGYQYDILLERRT